VWEVLSSVVLVLYLSQPLFDRLVHDFTEFHPRPAMLRQKPDGVAELNG
jgi:hypothetical protein